MKQYESDTGIGVKVIQIIVSTKGPDGLESHGIYVQIKYKVLGTVQQILTTLMNRDDGPVFASYQTTSDELWNYGTPANADGGEPPIQIDSGYDDDEFMV